MQSQGSVKSVSRMTNGSKTAAGGALPEWVASLEPESSTEEDEDEACGEEEEEEEEEGAECGHDSFPRISPKSMDT